MTLSFHKVMFSAEEVLDLIEDVQLEHDDCPCDGVTALQIAFTDRAEQRSREG